jgi:hypothetical protein
VPAIAFEKKRVYIVHPSFRVYVVTQTIHTNRIKETLKAQSIEKRIERRVTESLASNKITVAIASQENGSGCLPSSSRFLPQLVSSHLNSVRRGLPRRLNSLRPSGQVSF